MKKNKSKKKIKKPKIRLGWGEVTPVTKIQESGKSKQKRNRAKANRAAIEDGLK